MLHKTTTGSPVSNLDSSDTPPDNTSDRQSVSILTQVTFKTTQLHHKKHRPVSSEHMLTNSIHILKEKKTLWT